MHRWPFIFILFAISGCSQKVVSFVNSDVNFQDFKTYTIVNYKVNRDQLSPVGLTIFNQIEDGISKEMVRRDYEKSSIDPDIRIRYEIISNQVTDVNVTSSPFYYSPMVTARTFLESALLVEMTDTKREKMIWQASIDMSQYDSRLKQKEIIEGAILKIFDTYLYRAGSATPDESLKLSK